jgi:threonine/homoserine/homoserine lactone efflux protein
VEIMVSFALTALVLIMIPGPDQALITRSALTGGRKTGFITMIGGVLGLTVHATAATVGLSAVLLASATAFTTMKIIGAVYLVWLGVQTLRTAARSRRERVESRPPRTSASRSVALRQGFLSNALNPKVALFFVTFLPQFLNTDGPVPWAHALVLSLVFAAIYLSWFSLYVMTIDMIGRFLRRPRIKARIEQVTGVLLVAFAARLIMTQTD